MDVAPPLDGVWFGLFLLVAVLLPLALSSGWSDE